MKRFSFLLLWIGAAAHGQALRDINYNYQYNPAEAYVFQFKTVRGPEGWNVWYELQRRDTAISVTDYTVQCDLRTALGDKEGQALASTGVATIRNGDALSGQLVVPASAAVQIVAAKVVSVLQKRAWFFYTVLDPGYPVNGCLQTAAGHTVMTEYAKLQQPYSLRGNDEAKVVSFYRDDFPPAGPAFSESLGRVSSKLMVDSTFTVSPGQSLSFTETGLYLVQKDTSAAEGFAFRVEDDYPRFAKVPNLAGPLMYICTKQEFDRIKLARGDKKAFDKVILSITGDTERAKKLMRSYFKRVELANQYFTSYKEGWKTDRGMIYIIFGLPDEVFRFADREVWSYKNSAYKASFDFVKSPTLFDPENYVLVREKKFTETWYEVIDLWRNARF